LDVLIFAVAVFVVVILVAVGIKNKMINDGKITNRSSDFVYYSEFFTTKAFEAIELKNVMSSDSFKYYYKGGIHGNCDTTLTFNYGNMWTAKLTKIEQTSSSCKYQFMFVSWKTKDYVPVGGVQMNMLLTGLEKAFLQIDPNTQVTKKKNEVSTKRGVL